VNVEPTSARTGVQPLTRPVAASTTALAALAPSSRSPEGLPGQAQSLDVLTIGIDAVGIGASSAMIGGSRSPGPARFQYPPGYAIIGLTSKVNN